MQILSLILALFFSSSVYASKNIVQLIEQNPQLTTFAQALTDTGLLNKLQREKKISVVAPTNSAIASISEEIKNELFTEIDFLRSWLELHIIDARVNKKTIKKEVFFPTLQGVGLTVDQTKPLILSGSEINDIQKAKNKNTLLVANNTLSPTKTYPDNIPSVVSFVDINRYMGLWYEIGRLPQRFQRKCGATTAKYTLKGSGKVEVLNTCKVLGKNGKLKDAKGIAAIADSESNAKLKVSFVPIFKNFGWFSGDYWVFKLGENYEYAMVGSPNRKSLWILSRTPTMPTSQINELLQQAEDMGFPVKSFKISPTW